MADKSKTVIVKRIKKGHEEHHGGSWKVAYADFVTAMMAFFLLLWLITMVAPEKRAAVAEYFKRFSIFKEAGQSFMAESSQVFEMPGGEVKTPTKEFGKGGEVTPEAMKEKLKKAVEERLKAVRDHVMVDVIEDGVRIQIIDTEGGSMFAPGSATPTPRAKQILSWVAEYIKDLPKRVAVEGHTDAAPYKGGKNTNWELSSARASTARRELEAGGLSADKIARVVGYADTELLIKQNPQDPRNRRISIILLYPKPKPQPVKEASHEPQKSEQQPQPSVSVPQAPQQTLPPTPPPAVEQQRPQPVPVAPSAPRIQPARPVTGQDQKNIIGKEIKIKPQKPIDIKKPSIVPDFNK